MLLTVTLNASIDKAYYVNSAPHLAEVNRVSKVINTAGGKGLNVARAIKACGGDSLASGFVGGFNGKYLMSLLEADKISHDFVEVEGETRSCINVLDGDTSTEFLEPGCAVTDEEIAVFSKKFEYLLSKGDIEGVTISGSLPAGVCSDYYCKLIEIANAQGVNVYLDTSGETLKNSLKAKPHFIKPNKEEAEELLYTKIKNSEDAADAAKNLVSKGIDIVCITLGGAGAVVSTKDQALYSYTYNYNKPIINTVGCGDTFVGSFALCDSRGKSLAQSLEFAIAASRSNAMSKKTGDCNMDEINEILKYVKTQAIS